MLFTGSTWPHSPVLIPVATVFVAALALLDGTSLEAPAAFEACTAGVFVAALAPLDGTSPGFPAAIEACTARVCDRSTRRPAAMLSDSSETTPTRRTANKCFQTQIYKHRDRTTHTIPRLTRGVDSPSLDPGDDTSLFSAALLDCSRPPGRRVREICRAGSASSAPPAKHAQGSSNQSLGQPRGIAYVPDRSGLSPLVACVDKVPLDPFVAFFRPRPRPPARRA
jgi:hypothetical protein